MTLVDFLQLMSAITGIAVAIMLIRTTRENKQLREELDVAKTLYENLSAVANQQINRSASILAAKNAEIASLHEVIADFKTKVPNPDGAAPKTRRSIKKPSTPKN